MQWKRLETRFFIIRLWIKMYVFGLNVIIINLTACDNCGRFFLSVWCPATFISPPFNLSTSKRCRYTMYVLRCSGVQSCKAIRGDSYEALGIGSRVRVASAAEPRQTNRPQVAVSMSALPLGSVAWSLFLHCGAIIVTMATPTLTAADPLRSPDGSLCITCTLL